MSKILGCIILLYLILGVGLAEASPHRTTPAAAATTTPRIEVVQQ
jgi:hypothetical protein